MKAKKLSETIKTDQLQLIEHILRTTGAWKDRTGLDKMSHYFVAKNEKLDTAVSLCFTIVASFKDLREPIAGKRCMVCDLYATSREEVKDKIISVVSDLQAARVDEYIQEESEG